MTATHDIYFSTGKFYIVTQLTDCSALAWVKLEHVSKCLPWPLFSPCIVCVACVAFGWKLRPLKKENIKKLIRR